jgi:hypothetical protein
LAEKNFLRFGTVGAPSSTPTSGTVAAIEHSARLGLQHLEIAWVQQRARQRRRPAPTSKRRARQHGITLSVHAPYFINLNSQTDELMSQKRRAPAGRRPQGTSWPERETSYSIPAAIITSRRRRSTSACVKN